MKIAEQKPSLLKQAWRINKPLTTLLTLCAITFFLSLFGLFIDPRVTQIVGTPVWAKTFKFSVSLVLYAASLLWALNLVEARFRKIANISASTVGSIFVFQMILIIIQGVRARPMHFNESTSLDSLLWQIMSIGNSLMLLGYIVLMVMAWRGVKTNPVLAWGIKLSFAVTLLSLFQGFLMPFPNALQQQALDAGQTLSMIGAHTVGSSSLTPDIGSGLPLLGWSTVHGDLRIGHFIGLHALQLLPLLALWLSRRRASWLSEAHRLGLLSIAAFGYSGMVGLVTWQALRGQSIVMPDTTTIAAFLSLLGALGLVVLGVLINARASNPIASKT
jgi:hypothetical protein